MLSDSEKMIEMPIRLNVVSEPPDEKIFAGSGAPRGGDPHAVELEVVPRGRRSAGRRTHVGHVSRVPIRPIGRKIRTSTSIR